jgi:dTDP-4-dehydrorhamnose reductase
MEQTLDLDRPKRKTILIFGISSFVGSNLAEFLKREYKVVGTYYNTPVRVDGIATVKCNVLNKEEVQLVIYAFRPDVVIYSVGIPSLQACSDRQGMAEALNTSGLFNVAEYAQRYKAQVCYISSGFVFSGEDRKYMEMDIPDPNTVYGKTQAAAEFYIQKTLLNYVIFRCGRLYGRGINYNTMTWFERLQFDLARHNHVKLDDSVKTGFLDVYYLALIIKMSIENKAMNRLIQVSSVDVASFYEFGKFYCEAFKESSEFISKTRWRYPFLKSATVNSDAEEFFFNLDTSNIEGFIKIEMPTIEESLKMTLNRFYGKDELKRSTSKGSGVQFI